MFNTSFLKKIILILAVFMAIYYSFIFLSNKKEGFTDNTFTSSDTVIENILPLVRHNLSQNENENRGYLVTVVNTDPSRFNASHLYKVYTLRNINSSQKYMPLVNSKIDDQSIIVDLNWYHDELDKNDISTGKKLMCVALKKNKKMESEYTIYIKESSDITSRWTKFNSSKNIKSVVFDLKDNMLGIDFYENQIYQLDNELKKWYGPVNYDKNVKVHKLFFDTDKHLMCISTDGNLYRKENIDWKNSEWKKVTMQNISDGIPDFKIYDVVHDSDGKLIALTKKKDNIFIRKQIDHDSNFVDYFEQTKPIKHEDRKLTNNDIFMLKTGIDTEKFDYLSLDSRNMDKDERKRKLITLVNLNHYLKFKRKLLNKCKNYRNSFSKQKKINTNISQNVPLFNSIDTLIKKLDK